MKRSFIRITFGLAVLFPSTAALATADDDFRVDVVVDLTDAGKEIAPPTPDHPAYYFPITVGYHEMGGILTRQELPPPTAQVQHAIAKALASQGYRVMTKQSQPSLVLVLWWGYMAPIVDGNSFSSGAAGNREASAFMEAVSSQRSKGIPGIINLPPSWIQMFPNLNMMLTLVGGNKGTTMTMNDPQREELIQATKTPHYYMMITAFDFQAAAQQGKRIKLWTARVSTETTDTSLNRVLPTLIVAGAPMFGRQTGRPQLFSAADLSGAEVEGGEPIFKGYQPTPAAAANKM